MFTKGAMSRVTISQGLKWALITQVLLAFLLVAADIDARWLPQIGDRTAIPSGPVSPGDQVRRYDPLRTQPDFTNTTTMPEIDIPSETPARLEFRTAHTEKLGEVVLIIGEVDQGDADRFSAFIAGLDSVPKIIALNSPGGVVDEALAIGRHIRQIEADTVMLPGMICLSSCPYVLAAGGGRSVSRDAAIGLHQHYYDTPGYMPVFLAVEGIQHGQGKTLEYLIEMGVDPSLMVYSLNTPPEEIYLLVEDELLSTRLATEIFQ